MTPRPRYRSYSQLTTYLECPEQYRLKYIERIPEDPAVWNVGGVAFHTCAEWFLKGEIDPVSPFAVRDAWAAAWQLAYQEVIDRNPDVDPDMSTWRSANRGKEDVDWWQGEGPRMVWAFIDWWRDAGLRVFQQDDELYLEHVFEVELGGVLVKAIPDALVIDEHGQVDILDYKSGRREPAGSLQLGVYKAAVAEGLGLTATWGLYYMTRKAALAARDLTAWTPVNIGEMFADFDSREKAGHYPPKPGNHCRFCGVKPHCTYFQNGGVL